MGVNNFPNRYAAALRSVSSSRFHDRKSDALPLCTMPPSNNLVFIFRMPMFQEIEPVFEQLQVPVPLGCVFGVDRDMYALHEQNKYSENAGKWTCGFCGKSFYEEKFLDKHFDTRHGDRAVTGQHATCLADYCDVFRCNIISGKLRPHFWDIAMCKDDDMGTLMDRCQVILCK